MKKLILLATLAIFLGCNAPMAPEPEVVLRAYAVPQALASETQNVLSSLLYRGKDVPKLGSVVLSPSGQVLVSAPASFHEGVAQIVKELQKGPNTPPPGVEIEYIALLARPGEATVPAGFTAPVTSVLTEIAKQEGLEMAVFDRAKLLSLSGDRAQLSDEKLRYVQVATVHGDKVLADIEIEGGKARLEAKVQLERGQPLVIARAGFEPRPGDPFFQKDSRENLALFYVVTAKVNE